MKHIWAATDDLSRANSGNTPCCEVTVFHAFRRYDDHMHRSHFSECYGRYPQASIWDKFGSLVGSFRERYRFNSATRSSETGEFWYYCSVPGLREARLEERVSATRCARSRSHLPRKMARDPTDLPPPIHARPSRNSFHVDLRQRLNSKKGQLDDKTTDTYGHSAAKYPDRSYAEQAVGTHRGPS